MISRLFVCVMIHTAAWRRQQVGFGLVFCSRPQHPSIIAANDFGVLEDQTPLLAMELINGETLGERFKRTGCLTVDQAISVFVQVCFGLEYAHQCGIVHRDIKPNNIMLLRGLPQLFGLCSQVWLLHPERLVMQFVSLGRLRTRKKTWWCEPLTTQSQRCRKSNRKRKTKL